MDSIVIRLLRSTLIFLLGIVAGLMWAKADLNNQIDKALAEHGVDQVIADCADGLEDAVDLLGICQENKENAYELYYTCDDTMVWLNRLKNEYQDAASYCNRQLETLLPPTPTPTPTPEPEAGGNT